MRAALRSASRAATARSAKAPIAAMYWPRPASETVPCMKSVAGSAGLPEARSTVCVVGRAAWKRASCWAETTSSSDSCMSSTSAWIDGASVTRSQGAVSAGDAPKKRVIWLATSFSRASGLAAASAW